LDDPEANQLTKTSKPLLDVILTTRDEAMLELFLSKKYLKYFNKLYDDFKKENQDSDKLQQMDEFIRKAEGKLGIKGRTYGNRGLPKLGRSGFRRTPYT
jgi:hypothetical protein